MFVVFICVFLELKRTKCDITEEEELDKEFKSLFPNFQQKDFADVQKQIELTDDDDDLPETGREIPTVAQRDVAFVIKLHRQLLTNYTKTEWINNQKTNCASADFVSPLLEKLKLYKALLDKSGNALDYQMDAETLGSLNVLIAVAENYGKMDIESKFYFFVGFFFSSFIFSMLYHSFLLLRFLS